MATIAEIRAQYPQYADMPDVALADALHAKFYADIKSSSGKFVLNLSISFVIFIVMNNEVIVNKSSHKY